MPTLIVTTHPDPDSLTHHLAQRLATELRSTSGPADVELADLAAEGFDPRYTLADRHTYRVGGDYTPDVAAEQERLDRATDLVLVFPVYWWSTPALLKGWFDRVFVNGWAFGLDAEGGIVRKLDRLRIHLVPVAGDDAGVYDRHGYEQAMRTQLEHGIVDFCGARRGVTAFVHDSEREDAEGRAAAVGAAVTAVVEAIRA
ncbi:NAD(P)H dehydrogenase [Plantibacter sp. Leaf171]|uniref:NAD(P)H-dependent oxidoreductase n=1 Tax=unclassified Plantibacter TaxID=2624265 RepID=UPI0007007F9D|nr:MULTISPECIES: NAD(P)H-dependent oxidoreductase [unclassified Plantibacter]KQM16534.1 NAD(P)H dehydrogenase [Plantibacter sp. Leaf1]KQR59669.1 NAD(P)H dehydrogenase [Plantibacter sp. Leaf171]